MTDITDPGKEGPDKNVVMDYLKLVSENIQHNENMRNRFFQFYLVISGTFLVLFKSEGKLPLSNEPTFLLSIFV